MEINDEMPFGKLLARIALGGPPAAIPDDDAARPVFAFGDATFELSVVERMVLDAHRQALVRWR